MKKHTMRRATKLAVMSFAFGLVALTPVTSVYAQQTNVPQGNASGTGLKISPVRTEMTIEPGVAKTLDVTVQNVSAATTEFKVLINDFVAATGESGQPNLLLDEGKYAPTHSLKRYVSDLPNVTIPGGQSKTVKVAITIPKDAAGGGYYGAVRFAPADTSGSKNVSLSASVGSLILVKVPGQIKEDLTIQSFDVRKGEKAATGSGLFANSNNLYATVRFKNQGNVHVQPFGKITVKKNGSVVQSIEINNTDPRGNVLPDSTRRFNDKLDKVRGWGKYTVEGNFGYGSSGGQMLSASTSFLIIPLVPVAIAAGLLGLLIVALFMRTASKKRTRSLR